jgi:hypothetical protein
VVWYVPLPVYGSLGTPEKCDLPRTIQARTMTPQNLLGRDSTVPVPEQPPTEPQTMRDYRAETRMKRAQAAAERLNRVLPNAQNSKKLKNLVESMSDDTDEMLQSALSRISEVVKMHKKRNKRRSVINGYLSYGDLIRTRLEPYVQRLKQQYESNGHVFILNVYHKNWQRNGGSSHQNHETTCLKEVISKMHSSFSAREQDEKLIVVEHWMEFYQARCRVAHIGYRSMAEPEKYVYIEKQRKKIQSGDIEFEVDEKSILICLEELERGYEEEEGHE